MTRADEIAAEVLAHSHIWDSFDQGRWKFAIGEHRPLCPDPHVGFHVHFAERQRGWDEENARAIAFASR